MTNTKTPPYPECHKCPLFQYQECTIASSRILTYFYCPVSEGFMQHEPSSRHRNGSYATAQPAA